MERLFYFIYQYRAFFTFLLLELLCGWLIISNNQYQSAGFFNTSNSAIASLNEFSQGVREYFSLRDINTVLAEENASLRSRLEQYQQAKDIIGVPQQADSLGLDSAVVQQFDFISAKVINNSVHRATNYITINKGSQDGVEPGMAVISSKGVVGKVRNVSRHFSVVTSVLHKDVLVSVRLSRTGALASAKWDSKGDPGYINLLYVPTHVKPLAGDTVVTSGFSSVYPQGVMVGIIEEVSQKEETLFYDVRVKLSQDFRKLSFVEVVRSHLKPELDSLERPFVETEQ